MSREELIAGARRLRKGIRTLKTLDNAAEGLYCHAE
jgi:hypothetical protein